MLWLIDWAQREYNADPNRVYAVGTSMGGSGSVSMALHHPEKFAAIHARVPVVSYTSAPAGSKSNSRWRIERVCGPLATTSCNDANTLKERMNGVSVLKKAKDLPFMFIVNGRTDASIPWYNNPPFYKKMLANRNGTAIFWNNEDHSHAYKDSPKDVADWGHYHNSLFKFKRNESFPAFTNSSDHRNPGNGDAKNGDIVGWINRGISWQDIKDEKDSYTISIKVDYPGIKYPITLDMTPRRCQNFKPKVGTKLNVFIKNQKQQ